MVFIEAFSRTPRGFEAKTLRGVCWESYAFSRTPRGFEAFSSNPSVVTLQLSAEPLVGLKRAGCWTRRFVGDAFSRTPRGFEAVTQQYSTAQ